MSEPRSSFLITPSINGKRRFIEVDARPTLLDALRDRQHLTGTKKDYNYGQCGACSVLADGRWATASCAVVLKVAETPRLRH